MDKFDEKVNNVITKLESEGKIKVENDKIYPAGEWAENKETHSKELFDPMAFEENEAKLIAKKNKWQNIFEEHRDFANLIIYDLGVWGDDIYNKIVVRNPDGDYTNASVSVGEPVVELLDSKAQEYWTNIFNLHPDFSDFITDLVDEYKDEVFDNLSIMHKDGTVALGWAD